MKRKLILAALCLLGMNNANALIVSVKDHGEIDATGMQISLTDVEEDPLSGNRVFVISGTLFADGPLTVQIARSEEGMNDEFCCAGQCTNGNRQKEENLNFTPSGTAKWYVHFYPEWGKLTHSTTTYTFSDGNQTLTLEVQFDFDSQDIENIHSSDAGIRKVLKNGIIYIIKDNMIYNL
ncbi:MAG: hypothetical protein II825_08290 [Paludibacteraceae bacterium]|nr:hypothetical protein [Paludibacteraceae bacterium]